MFEVWTFSNGRGWGVSGTHIAESAALKQADALAAGTSGYKEIRVFKVIAVEAKYAVPYPNLKLV